MAPEFLSSNVMNYLVYRYLVEAGYLRAAERLKRSWVGVAAGDDLGWMPFAKNVGKNALVELVQDGLFLDTLESSARQTPRRHSFGTDHGPNFAIQTNERPAQPYAPQAHSKTQQESSEIELDTAAQALTPSSSNKRPSRRKKATAERLTTNGDTPQIELDDVTAQPPTAEPLIETIEPEATPPSPVIPTLDIGQSHNTQTEGPRDLSANLTIIVNEHTTPVVEWSPSEPEILFTGGSRQSELYRVESVLDAEDRQETNAEHVDLPTNHSGRYEIEHFCWTTSGQAAVVVSEPSTLATAHRPHTRLVRLTNWGTDMQILSPISGIVLSLQYQPESQLLLCICGLDDKSIIHIWRLTSSGSELVSRRRPMSASKQSALRIHDGAWMSPTRFIVCGEGSLQIYEVKHDLQLVTECGLEQDNTNGADTNQDVWSRLRFDTSAGYAAVFDSSDNPKRYCTVFATGSHSSNTHYEKHSVWPNVSLMPESIENEATESHYLTELQWQPLQGVKDHISDNGGRLLGISKGSGDIELYSVQAQREANNDPRQSTVAIIKTRTFNMGDLCTASAFSFSPNGNFLAAAGFDVLMIWRAEDGPEHGPHALWRWSRDAMLSSSANSTKLLWKTPSTDDDYDWPQSLQWDSEGKKLAFAMDDRIAIVRL